MPKVFVPQQPSRYDSATQLWVPTVNLDPASKHGQIIVLLPPEANRLHTAPLVEVLKERMAGYSDEDFIVAVGDPTLMVAAACIAAKRTHGLVRMLKWDRRAGDYVSVEIRL